jgi:hypothetical protein
MQIVSPFDFRGRIMKKIFALVALAGLGVATLGCEPKPAATPANTPAAPSTDTPPADPATPADATPPADPAPPADKAP